MQGSDCREMNLEMCFVENSYLMYSPKKKFFALRSALYGISQVS
jgi:hypothetical protein